MSESTATLLSNAILFLLCVMIFHPVGILVQKSPHISRKVKRFVTRFITTMLLPGILSLALANINEPVWKPLQGAIVNFLMGGGKTPEPDAGKTPESDTGETPESDTGEAPESDTEEALDPNKEFEQHTHILSNEEIQYTSSQYEIKIILPTRYECKSYTLSSGDGSEEKFELYYDEKELTVNISITDSAHQLFESIGEYYAYYKKIHENKPNIYCPLYEKGTPPYCVFSFNFDEGKEIYYELTYNLDGIWCITRFTYPTDNRAICDSVIKRYVKTSVL